MYRCELCNTSLLERNKTKHDRSKKHRLYSNLLLNRYVIKDVELAKIKAVFNLFFYTSIKKIQFFNSMYNLKTSQ